MTSTQARRHIFAALLVMGGITFLREVQHKRLPEPRYAVGAFAAAVMLSMVAGPLPEVASGIALVAVATHLIREAERGTLGPLSQFFDR